VSKLVEAAYDLTASACHTPFFVDGEPAQEPCCVQAFVNTLLNLCLLVRDTAAALEKLERMRDHVDLEDQDTGNFALLRERVTPSKLLQALDQTASLSNEFTAMTVALKLAFFNDGVKATLVQKNIAKKSSAELLKQQAAEGSSKDGTGLSSSEKTEIITKMGAMQRPLEVPAMHMLTRIQIHGNLIHCVHEPSSANAVQRAVRTDICILKWTCMLAAQGGPESARRRRRRHPAEVHQQYSLHACC
jgi:hypothetical protein